MEAYLLLAAAAFVAGTMNAVAGGGTFVTFPALMFTGVPSIIANASNAVALFPASFASAWAYRHDFEKFEGVSLKAMVGVSLVGGLTGAPVVAVPTSVGYGAALEGVTALLAMLASCAAGITVVGIDNGYGAACAVARLFLNPANDRTLA